MPSICVVYHSGYGHTKAQADAVADGARSVLDTEVHQVPVQHIDAHWEQLHAADALIFGTPTYMGTVSAEFKTFMDKTSQFFANQPWKDKLAAGFTNSGSQHGDKLNTLMSLAVFAAQHGMNWINLGLLPGHNSSKGSVEDLNRIGGFLGAMAQSNMDEGPDVAPPKSDRETAFQLGRRVADAARRWQQKATPLASLLNSETGSMWNDTAVTRRLGIRYPIVQGPFGGGLSSARLVAAVSDAGGLGSFGAQGMTPDRIYQVVREIRALTASPFAVNLWVSTEDAGASGMARGTYEAAVAPLAGFFSELHVPPPTFPLRGWPSFDEQVSALLDARPPVFSFVFGVPPMQVIDECRRRSIVTVGAATTVDEAVALEDAGVDVVVASGSEAGGHRPSFLRPPETSLTGLFSLLPEVCDAVDVPVIAAGGIADGRGVAAALALGAEAVQIGTAFLACEESNAPPAHREALFGSRAVPTVLTRAFSGRLARGLRNTLADALEPRSESFLPYPLQGQLVGALRDEAIRRGRIDLISLWSGQSRSLLRHRRAKELFQDLVEGAERALNRPLLQGADG